MISHINNYKRKCDSRAAFSHVEKCDQHEQFAQYTQAHTIGRSRSHSMSSPPKKSATAFVDDVVDDDGGSNYRPNASCPY